MAYQIGEHVTNGRSLLLLQSKTAPPFLRYVGHPGSWPDGRPPPTTRLWILLGWHDAPEPAPLTPLAYYHLARCSLCALGLLLLASWLARS